MNDEVTHQNFQYLKNIIGVLVKKMGGEVKIKPEDFALCAGVLLQKQDGSGAVELKMVDDHPTMQ